MVEQPDLLVSAESIKCSIQPHPAPPPLPGWAGGNSASSPSALTPPLPSRPTRRSVQGQVWTEAVANIASDVGKWFSWGPENCSGVPPCDGTNVAVPKVGCAQGSWGSKGMHTGVQSALASFGSTSYANYMVHIRMYCVVVATSAVRATQTRCAQLRTKHCLLFRQRQCSTVHY